MALILRKLRQAPRLSGPFLTWLLTGALLLLALAGWLDGDNHLWQQRLSEVQGHLSLACLFLTLVARQFDGLLPGLLRQRRSLGLLTFGFALLHTQQVIVHVLGGSLENMLFLSYPLQLGIWMGGIAGVLLTLLALTSHDWAVRGLGPFWKFLHKGVYLVAALILIHTIGIGVHYIFVVRTLSSLGYTAALLWVTESVWHIRRRHLLH
jgi:methionine sulfoxide reductase heme-binding subunit